MGFNFEKLDALSSNRLNIAKEKSDELKKNRNWLQMSRMVALALRYHLRKAGIRQNVFAEMLGVSPAYVGKLLKGNENLTLETISRIQDLIEEDLITVHRPYENRVTVLSYDMQSFHFEKEKEKFETRTGFEGYSSTNNAAYMHLTRIMKDVMYKYAKIELEQFALFEDSLNKGQHKIQLQTEAQFQYDKEQHVLCSKITVTFLTGESPLMKAVANSYFLIAEESIKHITDAHGSITFPKQVLIQFASLNYGSLRGMIHLKTVGTKLANYILPPMFFNEIITKDYVI